MGKFLYRFHFYKNGKKVASVSAIAFSKFDALIDCQKYAPDYDLYDYNHIREAKDEEEVGVILSKNDLKRKLK